MLSKKELEKSRNEMFSDLTTKLEELVGKSVTRKQIKVFYEYVMKQTFLKAAETGYLRLPSGIGLIRIIERKKLRVNTPTCGIVEVPSRLKIRFENGSFQKRLTKAMSSGVSVLSFRTTEAFKPDLESEEDAEDFTESEE